MGDAPFREAGAIKSVKVHPVVLFSILDHYMRRNEDQRRVIGTLLGHMSGQSLEIQNCFPVPHQEKGEEVAIGKDFNAEMNALHAKVCPNEDVVGWYATALNYDSSSADPQSDHLLINTQSVLIHQYYVSECNSPLHLVVDTNLASASLSLKAFLSTSLSADGRPLAAAFTQIPVEIVAGDVEKIGLGNMLQNVGSPSSPSSPVHVVGEMERLEDTLENLVGVLDGVHKWVKERASGGKDKEGDAQIADQIAQVMASVPRVEPSVFVNSFQTHLKDMLMLVYLSNLTRAQLSVAQRLHNTVG